MHDDILRAKYAVDILKAHNADFFYISLIADDDGFHELPHIRAGFCRSPPRSHLRHRLISR